MPPFILRRASLQALWVVIFSYEGPWAEIIVVNDPTAKDHYVSDFRADSSKV